MGRIICITFDNTRNSDTENADAVQQEAIAVSNMLISQNSASSLGNDLGIQDDRQTVRNDVGIYKEQSVGGDSDIRTDKQEGGSRGSVDVQREDSSSDEEYSEYAYIDMEKETDLIRSYSFIKYKIGFKNKILSKGFMMKKNVL